MLKGVILVGEFLMALYGSLDWLRYRDVGSRLFDAWRKKVVGRGFEVSSNRRATEPPRSCATVV